MADSGGVRLVSQELHTASDGGPGVLVAVAVNEGRSGLVVCQLVESSGIFVLELPVSLAWGGGVSREVAFGAGESVEVTLGLVEMRSESSMFGAPFCFTPAGRSWPSSRFGDQVFPPMGGGGLELALVMVNRGDGSQSRQVITVQVPR